jgi:hypothetical protein
VVEPNEVGYRYFYSVEAMINRLRHQRLSFRGTRIEPELMDSGMDQITVSISQAVRSKFGHPGSAPILRWWEFGCGADLTSRTRAAMPEIPIIAAVNCRPSPLFRRWGYLANDRLYCRTAFCSSLVSFLLGGILPEPSAIIFSNTSSDFSVVSYRRC